MSKHITSHDLFAHPIALSFNNKGTSHKTLLGGLVSILIKLLLVFYFFILLRTLVFNQDDKNTSVISGQELEELGTVNFNETYANMFFLVFDQYNFKGVPYDENVQKYMTFSAG